MIFESPKNLYICVHLETFCRLWTWDYCSDASVPRSPNNQNMTTSGPNFRGLGNQIPMDILALLLGRTRSTCSETRTGSQFGVQRFVGKLEDR